MADAGGLLALLRGLTVRLTVSDTQAGHDES